MNLPNQTQHPLGESIWVRRDHPDHGVLFILRETTFSTLIGFYIALTTLLIFIIAQMLFGSDVFNLLSSVFIYIFLTLGYVCMARVVLLRAHLLAVCPLVLYSEQIDPVQLVIHQIMKPPVIIPLQGSHIDSKSQLNFFTKLTIKCQIGQPQATLTLLTPEEHHRFMAYWNAANPPPKPAGPLP